MAILRFGTLNLLHGSSIRTGSANEADLRSATGALDADLLGLQEVDRGQPRSNKTDQAAVVADELRAPWWRFSPVLSGTPLDWSRANPGDESVGSGYGVALVSRLRVLHWDVLGFPAAPVSLPLTVAGRRGLTRVPDQPRAALAAVVVGPEGPFTVATAHLSFVPGWNARQLRAVTRWLASLPPPRILCGDLNLPGRRARFADRLGRAGAGANLPIVATAGAVGPHPRVRHRPGRRARCDHDAAARLRSLRPGCRRRGLTSRKATRDAAA